MNTSLQGVTDALWNDIEASRAYMKQTKPLVYEKLLIFLERQKTDIFPGPSLLDWAYSFDCNFKCEHCGTSSLGKGDQCYPRKMPISVVKSVADQAHQIGFFTISFIGGEPLLWPELDSLIEAVEPERFYITVLTNGWFLSRERAKRLSNVGVNKIGISIDSGIEFEHDCFRNKKGSFKKAVDAINYALDAGLRVHISTTVTHQNIASEGIKCLLELSKKYKISIDLQCATVAGRWRGNFGALLDDRDVAMIETFRKEYPLIRRDLLPTPGCKGGCPALTGSVFLTESGDILPCLFIHIALGNIYRDSLFEILQRGSRVCELMKYSTKCLAGEDEGFINKYLTQTFNAVHLPLSFSEGFLKEKNNSAED